MLDILLISSGLFHPGPFARWHLRKLLRECVGVKLRQRSSLEGVTDDDYTKAQLVVLYFHHAKVKEETFVRFKRYVDNGGSILAIHAATASFKQFMPWFDVLGGRFTGHGPVHTIKIMSNPESPLVRDLPDFDVTDELYHHDMRGDVDVHLFAINQDGCHPLVWTRTQASGRIAYMGFGHRGNVFAHPRVAEIASTLIAWLTG